jgi:hypothetical protein
MEPSAPPTLRRVDAGEPAPADQGLEVIACEDQGEAVRDEMQDVSVQQRSGEDPPPLARAHHLAAQASERDDRAVARHESARCIHAVGELGPIRSAERGEDRER